MTQDHDEAWHRAQDRLNELAHREATRVNDLGPPEPKKQWGLYDTQDNCWLGNEQGPNLYDDEQLAEVAARVFGVQLRWTAGRVRHREYVADDLVLKDEVDVQRSGVEAIRLLEEGRTL